MDLYGCGIVVCVFMAIIEYHKWENSPYREGRKVYHQRISTGQADDDKDWKPPTSKEWK